MVFMFTLALRVGHYLCFLFLCLFVFAGIVCFSMRLWATIILVATIFCAVGVCGLECCLGYGL